MDAQDVNGNVLRAFDPEFCGGATDKGPRRAENQDAFWIPDQDTPIALGALFLVADGVGGQQDGAIAAKLSVKTVHNLFYILRQQGDSVTDALKKALEEANRTVLDESQKRDVRKMGATFVAAVQDRDKLVVAHVGDARAYLIRQGEMRQLTRDDTWVQRQVDAGLITEDEAARHEFRNVVTQVLGNKQEINVNLSQTLSLQPGDTILLCSDGLYGALPDSHLISLSKEKEPQNAARLLVEAAIAAEASDNITAVVVRIDQSIPITDVPTLVPPPAPQTIVTSPPPVKDKSGIPKWLIGLAAVAIILIIAALMAFWLQTRGAAEDSKAAAATAMPAIVESLSPESAGALEPLEQIPTRPLPTTTIELLPTATFQLVETPTPQITLTSPAVAEQRGCVNDGEFRFVWNDSQIFDGNCDISQTGLEVGEEVRVLSKESVIAGGTCGGGQFTKIQTITEPPVEGWIRNDLITLLLAGENCGP